MAKSKRRVAKPGRLQGRKKNRRLARHATRAIKARNADGALTLILERDLQTASETLGILRVRLDGQEQLVLHTIERPWIQHPAGGRGGQLGASCVPAGTYRFPSTRRRAVEGRTETARKVWALINPDLDVFRRFLDIPPERSGIARCEILMHSANFAYELEGCIAPGITRSRSAGRWQVTDSREAMKRLRRVLGWPSGVPRDPLPYGRAACHDAGARLHGFGAGRRGGRR